MKTRFVLVIGATGNQGRAVIESLLKRGHRARALVRDSNSQASRSLKEMGAELVVGTFDDPKSLEKAAAGVDAVFAMTTPMAGIDLEIKNGKTIVDTVTRLKTPHLVFSSVANADQHTNIPHFDSKYEIEKYIQTREVPCTVIGPVFFMNNVLFPWNITDLKNGIFRQAMKPDLKLKQISTKDIGNFSAWVIEKREPFIGKRFDIAADELSGHEMTQILSKTTSRTIEYVEQPIEEVRSQSADMATMYEWFENVGFTSDIERLRRDYPKVEWWSFEQWASAQDWESIL